MNKRHLICLLSLFLLSYAAVHGQQAAKTFYFMDNAPIRLGQNPALQPQKGFFSFPLLGSIGFSATSNTLNIKDLSNIMENQNKYLNSDLFINKLKKNNYINADLSLDLISFGFYYGKGFWSVDIDAKLALGTSIPRSMFEFVRETNGLVKNASHDPADILDNIKDNYEIRDMQLHLNTFGQIGLGYSRSIMDWLTVGGKVKFLIGLGNVDMQIEEMSAHRNGDEWQIKTKARMDVSMQGLKITESSDGYIDDFEVDKPGIGGYGLGLDFGVQATLLNHLNISAAIIDLGFINWSASANTTASTDGTYTIEADEEFSIFDEKLFQLRTGEKAKSRNSRLYSTLNLGAEYSLWRNRIGVGLLSSTTFYKPEAYSELTASVNFRPGSWFGASLSYSFLHSDFKTFGFGLRLGPIFLATDYMITGNIENIRCANAYLGINFPIGKKNGKYKEVKNTNQ